MKENSREGHSVTYATPRDNKASTVGIRAKPSHPLKFVSLLPFIALSHAIPLFFTHDYAFVEYYFDLFSFSVVGLTHFSSVLYLTPSWGLHGSIVVNILPLPTPTGCNSSELLGHFCITV